MSRERQPYPLDHGSHLPILIGIGLKIKIRRVLELGAGSFSTPLFLNRDIYPDVTELVSVERDPEWVERIRTMDGQGRITLTPDIPTDYSRFDLIFIDNASGEARVAMIRHLLATDSLPALTVIHDAESPPYKDEFKHLASRQDFTAFNPETSVVWRPGDDKTAEVAEAMHDIDTVTRHHFAQPPDDVAAWVAKFKAPVPGKIPDLSANPVPAVPLTVSVTMSAYRRAQLLANTLETYLWQTRKPDEIIVVEDGFDEGLTRDVCERYSDRLPMKYFCRRDRPDIPYSNSAVPRNIGIRKATGDILVMQNPEVRFTKPTDFANLVEPTERNPMLATYAPCKALTPDGSFKQWYQDPQLWAFNVFLSAHRREHIIALGGFSEKFKGYGWEDNDFNMRYLRIGVQQVWAKDVVTEHQWHEVKSSPKDVEYAEFNRAYSAQVMEDIIAGRQGLEANVGCDWGVLNTPERPS